MTAVLQEVDSPQEFFAPSNHSALDLLLEQYRETRANIDAVAEFMQGPEMLAAAGYFFDGNEERFARFIPDAAEIFQPEPALAALNARYWQRALDLTDVMDYMPDARRQEWYSQIREMKTPEFEEKTVRATIANLLDQRMGFLSEMVDGIFRGLSGEHVTNQPQGFGKRMIIRNVVSEYGFAGDRAGLLHDLRSVIAKFMGRDQLPYGGTRQALEHFRKTPGRWFTMDGGALRVRVYKNGNGHMEVHPQIAYRLNQVLAHLYPNAIPQRFRKRPSEKMLRDFTLLERPLPFAVLKLIAEGRFYPYQSGPFEPMTFSLSYSARESDKHTKQEVARVLEAIGGVALPSGSFRFDYDASDVIQELLASGVLPDQKSYQYYPTPRRLAEIAIAAAEIGEHDRCLEPSAGQGALADLMPKARTFCVEASALHCQVLESKGYEVHHGDFMHLRPEERFDRIVMNPPFSQGRAAAHVQHAANLLAPAGRLVAILPASLAGKDLLPGFKTTWTETYDNEFAGTSVSVAMLIAEPQEDTK